MSFCRRFLNFSPESNEIDLDQVQSFDFELADVCLKEVRELEKKFGLDAATFRSIEDKRRRRLLTLDDRSYSQGGMKPHPYLDSPRYDGADPNVQPAPDLNVDTENALQERLELTYAPKPGQSLPKPRPY